MRAFQDHACWVSKLKRSMTRSPPPCPVIPSVPDRDILCALPARCCGGCSGPRRALHPALRLPPLGPLLAIPRLLPPGFLPPPEHQYSAIRLRCHAKAAPVGSSSEACPSRLSISCLLLSSAGPRRHASMMPDRLLLVLPYRLWLIIAVGLPSPVSCSEPPSRCGSPQDETCAASLFLPDCNDAVKTGS